MKLNKTLFLGMEVDKKRAKAENNNNNNCNGDRIHGNS